MNGLAPTDAWTLLIVACLTGIDDLSFVYLSSRDVVRHKIVQDIVEAYRRYDEARS